jgi:hypothetical protein
MWLASLGAAAGARAAACGWYPVCPYTVVQTLGDTDPASLEGPMDVAVTPGGDVLVADLTKESVREFDASGQFIRQIGAPGSFQYVDAVAVDQSSGEIWVADQTGVHGFSPTGTLESTLRRRCPTPTSLPQELRSVPRGTSTRSTTRRTPSTNIPLRGFR